MTKLVEAFAVMTKNNLASPLWRLAVTLALAALLVACRTPVPAPSAQAGPARIALVSDTHVLTTFTTNKEERLYSLRFAKTIEAVNAANVDLVLVGGDLTEHGTPAELAEFRRTIRGFHAPVWCVPGNHDLGNKRIPGKKNPKAETNFGRVRDYELTMGRSFWVREAAGTRIIGLNSGLFGSKLPRERTMWDLLESELEKTNTPPTIILQHHPPFLKTVDEPGGDYFNMEPYPRARLLALAKQGRVKAILSGHLHRGLTNTAEGVLLYTTPPVSFGSPKGKLMEGWTLVTVSKKEVKAEFQRLPKVQAPAEPAEPPAPAKAE
ncbi:MAG: metallophosphoesterase [Verrucomicrobia bacterium]|nr:metallophosphoesterase [Verrucomicrobiota bacterium]